MVSRACPCLKDEHFIRYHLPQERGWTYIHDHLLELGCQMRWPRSEDNPEGRWWRRLLRTFGL